MNKEEAEILWLEQWQRPLTHEETQKLNDFFEEHPELKEAWDTDQKLWDSLESDIPEPSIRLDRNFYNWLNQDKPHHQKSNYWQWAAAVALLILGFGLGRIGYWGEQQTVAQLDQKVESLQQMMLLTLIEQPSAQDRLKAVNISETLVNNNDQVIQALVTTLQKDPNANVRLAALDALLLRAAQPEVREALVMSISFQDNPLLQSAMADAMLRLQESKGKIPLQKILEEPELNPMVREKIQNTLQQI